MPEVGVCCARAALDKIKETAATAKTGFMQLHSEKG